MIRKLLISPLMLNEIRIQTSDRVLYLMLTEPIQTSYIVAAKIVFVVFVNSA